MQDKRLLRRQAWAQRQTLTIEEMNLLSQKAVDCCIEHMPWHQLNYVHCYLPCTAKNELNIWPLIQYLWLQQPQIKLVSNRLNDVSNQLDCCIITPKTSYLPNRFGIAEPSNDALIIDPGKLELMILPLLACDHHGHRLGYGKGYYDRLLARCSLNMRRVGINYFPPLAESIPYEAHDQKLNALITDKILDFSNL